jgi:hypothetical protein
MEAGLRDLAAAGLTAARDKQPWQLHALPAVMTAATSAAPATATTTVTSEQLPSNGTTAVLTSPTLPSSLIGVLGLQAHAEVLRGASPGWGRSDGMQVNNTDICTHVGCQVAPGDPLLYRIHSFELPLPPQARGASHAGLGAPCNNGLVTAKRSSSQDPTAAELLRDSGEGVMP